MFLTDEGQVTAVMDEDKGLCFALSLAEELMLYLKSEDYSLLALLHIACTSQLHKVYLGQPRQV
jgi:hypothetical protein